MISVPDSKIVLTVFAAIFLVLFQIFSPLYPVFQESASFLAGMKYFSLTDGAPDAPGHYFYTVALRWSSSIAGDGFEGMLLLNRLFALVSLWSVYRAARFLHGKTAGFLAALVFVLHPFIIISAVAGDPAFASVAVYSLGAYLAIRTIRDPDPVGLFRFSLLTGIAGGFSLTAFIALLPLWTVLAYRTKDRHDPLSASVLVLLAGIALWLLPSVSAAGGLSELIRLLSNGPSWRATDIASHIVEYAKAFAVGGLLLSVVLFSLLRKATHAYRGRLLRHSLLLTLPCFIVSLLQAVVGSNPDALLIIPVSLIVFCAVSGALLFEPETSINGRRRFAVLGMLIAFPGIVFLVAGGRETGASLQSKEFFHSEQWTIGNLKYKESCSVRLREYAEQFAAGDLDSLVVVIASKGAIGPREIASLLSPCEVYDMQLSETEKRPLAMYYHKHRRFLLTENSVELHGKTLFFAGGDGILHNIPEGSRKFTLPDNRIFTVVRAGTVKKAVFTGNAWFLE